MMRDLRLLHLTVLALAGALREPRAMCIPRFRLAENSSEAAAGNVIPIVHTGKRIDPTVQQAAPWKACPDPRHVREDNDAPSCLELRQIHHDCGPVCERGREHRS